MIFAVLDKEFGNVIKTFESHHFLFVDGWLHCMDIDIHVNAKDLFISGMYIEVRNEYEV